VTEWMAEWLYAPEEEWSVEQEMTAHKEILAEIERMMKWTKDPKKMAELEAEAIWRRSEINRLKEQMKRTRTA